MASWSQEPGRSRFTDWAALGGRKELKKVSGHVFSAFLFLLREAWCEAAQTGWELLEVDMRIDPQLLLSPDEEETCFPPRRGADAVRVWRGAGRCGPSQLSDSS